jgi:protein-S-isoprenylcysteine O-methyltransferase Ste14
MSATFAAHLGSFIMPVTAAGIVPALLELAEPRPKLASTPLLVAGSILVLLGLTLLVWTVTLFVRIGRGTLAPWNPTRKLVLAGPYAHSRNPMISGVACTLAGEALALGSLRIATWAALFIAVNHVYFIVFEEPGLVKRFGSEYEEYKRNVPRWILRRQPWAP